ncbi:hypothetical protein [Neorhodopirellula pilleata]|uniref:Uncharacterized protein n=1 Tax=Neorhodopirellula pilleata TaxID=2714738 RepID=A0A5C5ZPH0_9BACT|nr:hypothetical protein [Neorhodopirellula pilleata]TWT89384.1 hypothetical protein Pla100_55470 [Neorhodopirellula pilleata]
MPSSQSKNRSAGPSKQRSWSIAFASLVVLVSSAYWLWPTPTVTLDDAGYQLTMALYRICNQEDAEGLEKVARSLDQSPELQSLSNESRHAIAMVISRAKVGDWKDALTTCRKLMDDQVRQSSLVAR